MINKKSYALLMILLGFINQLDFAYGQGCDPTVPSFNVNLTSSPSATYVSPLVNRNGNCCGTTNPDRCLEFIITLHQDAVAINFQISGGAVPPGALFYQINCGPPIAVGSPICLNGPGPHILTFCKPGNNANQFSIISYPAPQFGPDLTLNQGCGGLLTAYYYDEASITWTSVSPGATGAYNTQISCIAGCDSTTYTAGPNLPSTIDYKVCGNDINGCFPDTICHIITVNNLTPPTVNITQDTIVKCPTEASVWVSAIIDSVNQPTNPIWSNGATTDSTQVGVGTHYVTITDTAGCNTTMDSIVVINQTILPIVDAGTVQVVCEGDIIQLAGTTSNSQNPVWSGGLGTFSNNNILNPTYTPDPSEYNNGSTWLYLFVESLNDCDDALDSVEIILATFTDLFTYSTTNISCFGANDGTATVNMTTSNGTPFTFALDGGTAGSTSSFTGLTPGSHSIVIVNALGCDTLIPFVIVEPPLLTASFTTIQNVSCNAGTDGSLTVTANGGTTPYTYSWAGFPAETSNTLSGLPAGNYSVTVTDANGCFVTLNQTLTEPSTFPTVDAGVSTPTCYGDPVALLGDTTQSQNPVWFGGLGSFGSTSQLSTTYSPTNAEYLSGSVWLYFQVDALIPGCPGAIDSVQLTLQIFDGQPTIATTDISCFGANDGTATVTMGNPADGPFSFALDGGTAGSTSSFTGLTPGSHSIVIVNALGCDTLIPFVIVEPPLLTASFTTIQNVSCNAGTDGSLTVTANGGTTPYTYSWAGFPAETSNTLSGLPAGNYSVTVTDANGCFVTLNQTLTEPSTFPTVDAGVSTPTCQGDLAFLSGNSSQSQNPVWYGGSGNFTSPYQLSTTYSPSPAEYSAGDTWLFLMVDAMIPGCPGAYDSVHLILNTFNGQPLLSKTNITCNGFNDGTASVTMQNTSDGPFTFSLDGNSATSANTFVGLSPGNHSITIVNSVGCDTTLTFNIFEPSPIVLDFSLVQMVSCYNGNNGRIILNANGGTPNYSYNWSNDPTLSSNINDTLSAGNYSIIVTDQNGCTNSIDTNITQPSALNNTFNFTPIKCNGGATLVYSQPTGGTQPYSFQWNGGSTTNLKNCIAGQHNVLITDANGCNFGDTVNIVQPTPLQLDLTPDTTICSGTTIDLFAYSFGGTPNYTFNWSVKPNDTDDSISFTVFSNSNVFVTLKDQNGCTITKKITIATYYAQNSNFQITPSNLNICEGDSLVMNFIYNGTAPIQSVYWQDCLGCPFPRTFYPTKDTTLYAVLVTICGDTLIRPVPINFIDKPDLTLFPIGTELCPNETLILSANISDPNAWFYDWDLGNGQTSQLPNPTVSYAFPGLYTVNLTVTNIYGCTYSSNNNTSIIVRPSATAQFQPDRLEKSIFDPTFFFLNQSLSASAYEWYFGDGDSSTIVNPSHTYAGMNEFYVTLIAKNQYGCNDTIVRVINIRPEFDIYIPNTFTPNGDMHNNSFRVKGFGLIEKGFKLMIFNRWGEIVYQSYDIHEGWNGRQQNDGKEAQDGTYTWKVTFMDLEENIHTKVGHVNILR